MQDVHPTAFNCGASLVRVCARYPEIYHALFCMFARIVEPEYSGHRTLVHWSSSSQRRCSWIYFSLSLRCFCITAISLPENGDWLSPPSEIVVDHVLIILMRLIGYCALYLNLHQPLNVVLELMVALDVTNISGGISSCFQMRTRFGYSMFRRQVETERWKMKKSYYIPAQRVIIK